MKKTKVALFTMNLKTKWLKQTFMMFTIDVLNKL